MAKYCGNLSKKYDRSPEEDVKNGLGIFWEQLKGSVNELDKRGEEKQRIM